MRQVTTKGLVTVVAAGGLLALSSVSAFADSEAEGDAANSPGIASGNNVQVPVEVPINACGNTVDVVGALNPALGNRCVNEGGDGAEAEGSATNSPGIASGNNVQAPVEVPINACGNTVDVVGALNPALGNRCNPAEAEDEDAPETPGSKPEGGSAKEPGAAETQGDPSPESEDAVLAETGSGLPVSAALPVGAGLLAGGALLYGRARAAARR